MICWFVSYDTNTIHPASWPHKLADDMIIRRVLTPCLLPFIKIKTPLGGKATWLGTWLALPKDSPQLDSIQHVTWLNLPGKRRLEIYLRLEMTWCLPPSMPIWPSTQSKVVAEGLGSVSRQAAQQTWANFLTAFTRLHLSESYIQHIWMYKQQRNTAAFNDSQNNL